MYGLSDENYAIGFFSGYDFKSDTKIFEDMQSWLIEKFFGGISSSCSWESLLWQIFYKKKESPEEKCDAVIEIIKEYVSYYKNKNGLN